MPVFVANGDSDPMILPHYSYLLAGLIPHARVKIYPDAAHGFLFQHHAEFAADVEAFLTAASYVVLLLPTGRPAVSRPSELRPGAPCPATGYGCGWPGSLAISACTRDRIAPWPSSASLCRSGRCRTPRHPLPAPAGTAEIRYPVPVHCTSKQRGVVAQAAAFMLEHGPHQAPQQFFGRPAAGGAPAPADRSAGPARTAPRPRSAPRSPRR